MSVLYQVFALTRLLLATMFHQHSSATSAFPQYELDSSWPVSSSASLFTAVAVDTTVSPTEIYVAQRGSAFPQPIIVYDEAGNILRSWGNDSISFIDGEFGVHGIELQYTRNGTFLFVADMLEHTLKKFTTAGVLVARLGTPNVAGIGVNPIQ